MLSIHFFRYSILLKVGIIIENIYIDQINLFLLL